MNIKYHKNWKLWTILARANLSFHSGRSLSEVLSKAFNSLNK